MMKRLPYGLLFVVVVLMSCEMAAAWGYRPGFAEAVKEAEIIVRGRVVESWYPKLKTDPDKEATETWCRYGELYRMHVGDVYKGDVRSGQELIVWDSDACSTASYFIREGGDNLTFLVKAEPSQFEKEHLQLGYDQLYCPIQNKSKSVDSWVEEYEAWLIQLDLTIRNPPADLHAAYRRILTTMDNSYVSYYVLEEWPEKLTAEDVELFKSLVRDANDPAIAHTAFERLTKEGIKVDEESFVRIVSWKSIEEMTPLVTRDNVHLFQDRLLRRVLYGSDYLDTIEFLAKLAPDFLKKSIREHDLPFWRLIPCLKALGINGQAVGKKDFPPEILNLKPHMLRKVGEVYLGDPSNGVWAMKNMEYYGEDWEPLVPLLEPLLREPDSAVRRMVVSLLRTMEKRVERSGSVYKLIATDKPVPPPVKITLEAPEANFVFGQPVRVHMKEMVTCDGVWLSWKGDLSWYSKPEDSTAWGLGSGPARIIMSCVTIMPLARCADVCYPFTESPVGAARLSCGRSLPWPRRPSI